MNPLQQNITENIFKPLGMNNTWWEYTSVPESKLAHGYRWVDNNWIEQPLLHDGSYGAMGGLVSTVEDFSKYISLHLSAWPFGNHENNGPVKKSSVREMHYPWGIPAMNLVAKKTNGMQCPLLSAYGYGLGWVKNCDDVVTVGHSGGLPGFGSQWRILPEYGIGIVSFANLTYARAGYVNSIAIDTLLAITGIKPRQLPPSAILIQRKNELLKLLPGWTNAEASGIFADNFFQDNFIEQLKKETTAIFKKAGKIMKIGELFPENNLRGHFIVEGNNSNIKISFTLTPEHMPLIQEFRISAAAK